MSWLNAVGNIFSVVAVGFVTSLVAGVVMVLFRATSGADVYLDMTDAHRVMEVTAYIITSSVFVLVLCISVLILWWRRRLFMEKPIIPGMSKYAKVTCIALGLVGVTLFMGLQYILSSPQV